MTTKFVLSLGALACACMAQLGASVIYTSTYDGSALPTASSPAWYQDAQGDWSASTSNGVLSASTMPNAGWLLYWAIGTNDGDPWGTSSVWNTSVATVDFRVKVLDTVSDPGKPSGFWIQLTDLSSRFWNFYVGENTLYSNNAVTGDTISVDLASLGINTAAFNDYRIAMSNGVASVYVNGRQTPLFDSVSGVSFVTRTAMIFGDAASFESAAYELDYLNWSNTTAEFSAPIPEAGTMALLGVGAMVGIAVRMGRKKLKG